MHGKESYTFVDDKGQWRESNLNNIELFIYKIEVGKNGKLFLRSAIKMLAK